MKVDNAHKILDTGLRKGEVKKTIPLNPTQALAAWAPSVAALLVTLLLLYFMPPDIAHQILRAKLRKRNKPPSYTTRPPSIPQHPQPSEDDDDVPFSPWAIGGCVLLTVVMLVLQFATVS
ncbi:hypothetical protein DYB35_004253 [Aphanomyces astaci]|uniref:Uncharacterized protein n=1 Tax=Aphanomyces astaci TaxID=112090 RepID=A0A3R6WZE1_APHAT|nr:hypothetical protein DYB35_004253 [Aphanomyces astaci]